MALGRRAGALVNAVLVLASVALSLAAVELYLVWDNWRPHFEHTTLEFGGQRLRVMEPAQELRDFHNTAVVVGDSFTHGAACGAGRNYPGQLDRLVRARGDFQRVVNLGVSGADPFMYLQIVEGLLASGREPSLVVVTLYANDVEFSCAVCSYLERIRKDASFSAGDRARLESFCRDRCTAAVEPVLGMASTGHFGALRRAHTWMVAKFYVYALLRDTLARMSMALGLNAGWGRTAYPPLWKDHHSLEFRLVKFALAGIRDALGGLAKARMTVVIYPDVQDLREDNVYVAIYRDVAEALSTSLGVPVASGYAAFLGNPEAKRNMSYSLVDAHPSCKAHELFAKWVFTRMDSERVPLLRASGR